MGTAARSSMPSMPLEWSLLVLAVLQIAGAQICGDVKTEYKTQGCCNDKTQKFDLKPLQDEFAFSLTELSQTNTGPDGGWDWPSAVVPLLVRHVSTQLHSQPWPTRATSLTAGFLTTHQRWPLSLRSSRRPRTAHLSTRCTTIPYRKINSICLQDFYTKRSPVLRLTTQMQLSYSEGPVIGPTKQPSKR